MFLTRCVKTSKYKNLNLVKDKKVDYMETILKSIKYITISGESKGICDSLQVFFCMQVNKPFIQKNTNKVSEYL